MRFTPGFHGRSRLDADSARVPPGQYVTNDFLLLSAGPTPDTRLADWTFTVRGALDPPISWAVAPARALFRKGADFTAAMAFEIASTNLVIELGLILALLLDWRWHRQLVRPDGRWRSFSAWLRRVVRSCRVVQAAVVSPVTSFQVLKRLAISLRYSSVWSR
jgi:hypothetical protein